jgi:chromosome segregation ATPase
MANFKFFDIGKANSEIERLETELASAAANSQQVSDSALALSNEIKQVKADLATAQKTIGALQSQVAEKDIRLATLQTDLTKSNAALADPSGVVEIRASARALEIVAAQGAKPISTTPAATPAKEKQDITLKGRERFMAAITIPVS